MLAMWPAAAGSALALTLAVELPGGPAISMRQAMAWSMIAHLEFAWTESAAGRLAVGGILDAKGTPFDSNANWKSLFSAVGGRKFVLVWPDDFGDAGTSFDGLAEALASLVRNGSETKGFWFSGVYHGGGGLEPRVGEFETPALPVDVPNGTPVAGIILP